MALHELEQQSFTAGGAKITCTTVLNRPPMNPSPQTLKLCKNISDLGKSLVIDFNWVTTGGGSDGNYCAALGIPTVDGLGPVGGGGHSIHEWLDANSIKPRLNLLIKTIEFITNSPIK
jgi:glutamate carboxypeptidase